jgi:hypothetical protein
LATRSPCRGIALSDRDPVLAQLHPQLLCGCSTVPLCCFMLAQSSHTEPRHRGSIGQGGSCCPASIRELSPHCGAACLFASSRTHRLDSSSAIKTRFTRAAFLGNSSLPASCRVVHKCGRLWSLDIFRPSRTLSRWHRPVTFGFWAEIRLDTVKRPSGT